MAHAISRDVPASARWLAVALVAAAILSASVLPRSVGAAPPTGPGPAGLVGTDKWLHALAYAGFAGALVYALDATGRITDATGRATDGTNRTTLAVASLALALAVAFGLAVELVQAPLPTRRFELLDVAANTAGATAAVVGWWASRRFPRGNPIVGETG